MLKNLLKEGINYNKNRIKDEVEQKNYIYIVLIWHSNKIF